MYEGYRVKINNTEVSNLLIASGTYSFKKERRLVRSWTDANGIAHHDYYAKPKVTIKFSIRERNLKEQKSICGIFAEQENLTVKYWDDYACEYKTGTFQMNEPQIKHKKGLKDEILYTSTEILLEEY